ncbi:MAG: globin [Verrucomicrobiota bacterium]|jgi:hemoglobin|nr:globin [Verrucomicrobiota bacterium]MEC8659645.1 globin [Verrucomicrobiota bacterium]|tara:strand:+ start:1421 stop:1792 length:372 start_codon:yes stop_codon:yes gene_type:complete
MEDVLKQIGEEGIHQLVSAFYRRVKSDDVLGPLYPKEDWEGAEQRLADFLVYRCGGSEKYIQERGHPRLRMRHMPFKIGEKERDRWISLMTEAMLEREIENPAAELLSVFFIQTADFMRNVEG